MSNLSLTMLSIDDKTITTDLDRAGYKKMGVLVKAASNYEEATKALKEGQVDIVVVNMDYKRIDAVEITRHLKATPEWQNIPVVLTSVQSSAKIRSAAQNAGSDLFVEQPLPRQYFIEKLRSLLEQKTRNTQRVQPDVGVEFTLNGEKYTCDVIDLSTSGALLATSLDLQPGDKIEVRLQLGKGKPLLIKGEVVRRISANLKSQENASGIGVRFTEFTADSQSRLENFIAKTSDSSHRMIYYL